MCSVDTSSFVLQTSKQTNKIIKVIKQVYEDADFISGWLARHKKTNLYLEVPVLFSVYYAKMVVMLQKREKRQRKKK